MKKWAFIVFTAFIVVLCVSCHSNTPSTNASQIADTARIAELTYIEDFYDFGTIKSGEVVSYKFYFSNTGNSPLIVKDVIPSCGCTSTKLSKTVFEPNETGEIEVTFNSIGWFGSQYKSVTLRTNSAIREKSVTIKANVV